MYVKLVCSNLLDIQFGSFCFKVIGKQENKKGKEITMTREEFHRVVYEVKIFLLRFFLTEKKQQKLVAY